MKVWCVSLIEDLGKFFSRPWRERGLFIEACILLGVMRAAILLVPFRRITTLLGLSHGSAVSTTEAGMVVDPLAVGWSIRAAAARTPWESACLAQALAGIIMLSRRGIPATLYLGVARDESDPEAMAAHAWLRCGDAILTGGGGVERFSALSSFSRTRAVSPGRGPHNDRTGP